MAKKFLYFIILWIFTFPFVGYAYVLTHFENGIYTIEKLKGDAIMSLITSFLISLGLVITLSISQKKNKDEKTNNIIKN